MFYIILKNGNLALSNETNRDFVRFATLKDLQDHCAKSGKDLEPLVEDMLSWIVTSNGVATGNSKSANFIAYATAKEVEEAGGDLKRISIKTKGGK